MVAERQRLPQSWPVERWLWHKPVRDALRGEERPRDRQEADPALRRAFVTDTAPLAAICFPRNRIATARVLPTPPMLRVRVASRQLGRRC